MARLGRVPISPGRLLIAAIGAVLALVVGVWLFRPPPPAVESTLPRAARVAGVDATVAASTSAVTTPARTTVIVDASGSVARPGVYRLRQGARVDDLIRVAGGLQAGADRGRLNLAQPLADGQRLYVPKVGEPTPPAPVDLAGGAGGPSPPAGAGEPAQSQGGGVQGLRPGAPIDLNSATADQLDTLPGVGPSTAAAILAYRTEHGPFHSVDDLLDVRGIGDAKLAALRAMVRV